jgi:hypothetical protein
MGAVVAMICLTIPEFTLRAAAVDSPFTSIVHMVTELAAANHIPTWFCKKSLTKIRKRVFKKAHFDICDMNAM